MEHPGKEKLENYAARRLSASEMTNVILHLESCPACFELIENLSPSAGNHGAALFSENEPEIFHLDYDEHLRPFVDNEADEATREIVESHTQNCANCAFQLRELREFAESLRLHEIEKNPNHAPNFWTKVLERFHQIPRRFAVQIALSIALIFLLGIVVFLYLRSENSSQIASQANNNAIENKNAEIQTNSNEFKEIIAETANKNIDVRKAQTSESKKNAPVVEDEFAELNALPEALRGTVQAAVKSEKIAFPAFLSVIRTNINLRGEATEKSVAISPNGEAIRQTSPRFSWKDFASADEKYVVELYDEQNNLVEKSLPLSTANWTPKNVLQRGRIYKWEVTAEKNGALSKTTGGKFKILERKDIEEISDVPVKSPFLRGVVFASKGLLTEAKNEFRQAVKTNDRAELAQKFLRQIEKRR